DEQHCYSHSWRIALLERFWQARHPPRYAAYLTPSSPRFRLSSLSGLMMLSCFAMVRGMRMMLCRLLMVLGCFLGHSGVSSVWWPATLTGDIAGAPAGQNRVDKGPADNFRERQRRTYNQ
ncbi:MAG: hypothetical protein QOF94_1130, partial [Acidobacteriaceae bacterium]